METERLILRQWRPSDFSAYAEINADEHVMRFYPSVLSREESDDQAARMSGLIEEKGWGFWAVEEKASQRFIGFVGLHQQEQGSGIPCSPMVEIGWRIAPDLWGKGYAPEAAQAALVYAFEQLGLEQVFAFTALPNLPSQRVMEKLGMTNQKQDFNHPKLPQGHALERHCLYRITRREWLAYQA